MRRNNSNVTVVLCGKEGVNERFSYPRGYQRQESLEENGENVTVGGGLMISVSTLIVALALFDGDRRWRRACFERMNGGALLRCEGRGQRAVNDRECDLFLKLVLLVHKRSIHLGHLSKIQAAPWTQ